MTPAQVQEIVRQLRAALPPRRVWVFDSNARGDWREGSDLDILVYTPEEIEERRESPGSIIPTSLAGHGFGFLPHAHRQGLSGLFPMDSKHSWIGRKRFSQSPNRLESLGAGLSAGGFSFVAGPAPACFADGAAMAPLPRHRVAAAGGRPAIE